MDTIKNSTDQGKTAFSEEKSGSNPLMKDLLKLNTEQKYEEENKHEPQPNFPPLTETQTRVSGRVIEKPNPPEYIVNYYDKGLIRKNIVCAIYGTGGTGKSFLTLQLAMAMANGSALGPFTIPKPLKVLYLAYEDDQNELDRRLWDVGKGMFPENLHAASLFGKTGALMELKDGNPTPTVWYKWLCKTIENHPGLEVLFLDPKSRCFGLSENDNDHNTKWVALLESIVEKYNITIFFTHHTSKENSKKIDQNMGRGAGGLTDAVRFAIGVTQMQDDTAQRYNIKTPSMYLEIGVIKINGAENPGRHFFFERTEGGVLKYIELESDRTKDIAEELCRLIADQEISTRDLTKGKKGRPIIDDLKETFSDFRKIRDIENAIDYSVKMGWIKQREVRNGGGRPKEILEVISVS